MIELKNSWIQEVYKKVFFMFCYFIVVVFIIVKAIRISSFSRLLLYRSSSSINISFNDFMRVRWTVLGFIRKLFTCIEVEFLVCCPWCILRGLFCSSRGNRRFPTRFWVTRFSSLDFVKWLLCCLSHVR